ncbi:MAG: carboxypeptidase regulatory-like domain-containing protein, partial [Ignavibacteria bacterium]|nr:carboxypeptidase regulatory-like domain-containing protein [Ignavibacteria bacterium]
KVVLYTIRIEPQSSKPVFMASVKSTNTNADGTFLFEKVANGSYYIQVIPLKEYMPAYYSSKDCGVREGSFAEQIIIKNEEAVKDIVICVKEIKTGGGGKISGKISESNGNPLDGVVVYAESQNAEECSFAVSEADGSYEISDLGVGVYKISADKIGFASASTSNAVIDYAKSAFNVSVDLTMPKNSTTDVDNQAEIPTGFSLSQNYPNPFNPETVISYTIPSNVKGETINVTLKVFDVLGNEVATLVNEFKQPGVYNSTFSTLRSSLTSGVYFYKLQAGGFSETKKMILIK